MSKTYTTADVISAATGILVGDIGGVYTILSGLHGRSLFTHELPAARREAEMHIREACPWLDAAWFTEALDDAREDCKSEDDASWKAAVMSDFVDFVSARVGSEHTIAPLSESATAQGDPLSSLAEMMGGDR